MANAAQRRILKGDEPRSDGQLAITPWELITDCRRCQEILRETGWKSSSSWRVTTESRS